MNEQHRNSGKRVIISVIVPVYNKEKYITECLDSLLDQPIDSALFEVICIDDGSTDDSYSRIRQLADSHENLTVIRQENRGVSAARNHGLKPAKGDYVWFVDADDFVDK